MDFADYVAVRGHALLRFAFLLTGQLPAAEDLTQTVLAEAFRRWSKLQRLEQPDAYLRRMIVNRFVSDRRRRSAGEVIAADPPERPPAADLADAVVADDAFRRVVDELAPRARAVVVLRYYLDLGDAEIADLLGVSASTVRSTASRALADLRLALATVTTGTGDDDDRA